MPDKSLTIRGDREVIQSFLLTTAKYDFSIYEKKILLRLIEVMQPLIEGKKLVGQVEATLFGDYGFTFPIGFFTDDDTNQARFKEAIKSLNERKIEYEDEETWRIIRLIEMPIIEKRGVIKFALSKQLVDLFLNFSKGYSKYNLNISLGLKSVYSMRLYEMMSGQDNPFVVSIKRLKEIFDVSNKYSTNTNFIRRTIDPAKRELDKVANWSFEFRPIKRGLKYELIEFTPIHYKEREPAGITSANAKRKVSTMWYIERCVRNVLTKTCGFTDRELKSHLKLIQNFNALYGNNAVNKLYDIWDRAQGASNPKGYIINAIKSEIDILTKQK